MRLWTWSELEHDASDANTRAHAETFRSVVTDPAFPCTFTWLPFASGDLRFVSLDGTSATLADDVVDALAALADLTRLHPDLLLVVFVEGEDEHTDLRRDFDLTRRVVRAAVRRDPEAHADPSRPDWALTVSGVPLFINVSSPRHRRRHSRNVGPVLTLVCQARASFDTKGRSSAGVREHIRSRLREYDDEPPHPALGSFGRAGNREAWQYFLGDGVFPFDPTVDHD